MRFIYHREVGNLSYYLENNNCLWLHQNICYGVIIISGLSCNIEVVVGA